MNPPLQHSLESIVSHQQWIQALARRLASDDAMAEDLAQEASIRALQRHPSQAFPARSWFVTVMRNLAFQWRREEANRGARQAARAQPDLVRSTEESVLAAARHRSIVEAIFALEEPYHTTILLRFFDDLPPREIAVRMDVPVSTVKTRMNRAIVQLRERLGPEFSPRRNSLAGLMARLGWPATGAGLVGWPLVFGLPALFMVGVLGLALTWNSDGTGQQNAPTDVATASMSKSTAAITGLASVRETSQIRTPVPREGVPLGAGLTPSSPRVVRGIVLDTEGERLAGVSIKASGGSGSALSSLDGSFQLEDFRSQFQLSSASPEWLTFSSGLWRAESTLPPVVIVAAHAPVRGRVVDPEGKPIGGVELAFGYSADFLGRYRDPLTNSSQEIWKATSDDLGEFAFEHFPIVRGGTLGGSKLGFSQPAGALPIEHGGIFELVLAADVSGNKEFIRGRVTTLRGEPALDAWVALGTESTRTDPTGGFAFPKPTGKGVQQLIAVQAGHLPSFAEYVDAQGHGEGFHELVLGEAPHSIEGVVLGGDGMPLPGAHVYLDDPTLFCLTGKAPQMLEALMAGARVDQKLVLDQTGDLQLGSRSWNITQDFVQPNATFHWVRSDRYGRFRLSGLLKRNYRLCAFDPQTLIEVERTVRAGEESQAHLSFVGKDVLPLMAGRVVNAEGKPLPGLHVCVSNQRAVARLDTKEGFMRLAASRSRWTLTDGLGIFSLPDVAREGLLIRIQSDQALPLEVHLGPKDDLQNLELVMQPNFNFRVELYPPFDRADGVAGRDRFGESTFLTDMRGGLDDSRDAFPIAGGRSSILWAGAETVELVFFSQGREVGRTAVHLVRHKQTTVRW